MDPNATLTDIATALMDGDLNEANYLAEDLAEWLRKGGFVPTNWDQYREAALLVCRTLGAT